MPNFYFDIETTGLNPRQDKILTIQFQELDRNTGEPKGELIIFKEWESSEKNIIAKFLSKTNKLPLPRYSLTAKDLDDVGVFCPRCRYILNKLYCKRCDKHYKIVDL